MRYEQMWNWIADNKPEVICEIGTWNGQHAARLMKLGQCKKYIGFDIWEDGSEDLDTIENNVKAHKTMEEARTALNGYDVELIQGNTRETIKEYVKGKEPFVDMVFIDGGHSKHTVKSDFINIVQIVKDTGTIFMDDYYFNCKIPDMGAQTMLAEANVPYMVLPKMDKVKDGSLVKLVKIRMIDVPRMPTPNMTPEQQWKFRP